MAQWHLWQNNEANNKSMRWSTCSSLSSGDLCHRHLLYVASHMCILQSRTKGTQESLVECCRWAGCVSMDIHPCPACSDTMAMCVWSTHVTVHLLSQHAVTVSTGAWSGRCWMGCSLSTVQWEKECANHRGRWHSLVGQALVAIKSVPDSN